MATSRPFAFNTGSTISGTEQLGDLAIGVDDIDYDGGVGGVIWWMGPDEDLGYIICRPNFSGTQPNPVGAAAYVRFLRSKLKTEESFVNLVNTVYGQSFTTGDECKTYLNNNGYWTSWISLIPSATPTPTPTITPTNTPTPTTSPIPVTGYAFNLVALPYNFPSSGNTIMNSAGGITSGSTNPNVLATGSRGLYWNSIDTDGVDRTNYFSGFTGQSITITMSQTGSTAIYSGDTNSLKQWVQSGPGTGFVFGAGIGLPPSGIPSGSAILIQSATTQWTIGLPVYISVVVNPGVTPTPTPTNTVTPTVTPTNTPTVTPTVSVTPTPSPTPNIVTSGLVIQLDAYESSSYPGTGTTVFDITSGFNHTLIGATYTVLNGIKCFECTTGTNRVAVNGTGPTLPTSGYTYITWARLITSTAGFRTLLYTNSPKYTPITIPNGTNTLGYWDTSFKSSGYDVASSAGVWVQYAVVGTNTSQTFYINGLQVGSTISAGAGGTTHWGWGNNDVAGQPWGHVANMYFYNRQLSLSEITQQYDYLAPRFVEVTPTPTSTSTPTITPTNTPTATPTITPSSTPTYVSSNLRLYYDPSNSLSYPGTGTTINDLSGNGLNGTMSNITFTSPYFSYNGTSSQVSVADNSLLEPGSGDWTMEVWVNQSVSGNDVVLGKFDNGGLTVDVSYSIRTLGTTYFAQIGSGSGSGSSLFVNSTNYVGTINTWYQLVYVFTNITANTLQTFVNGVSVGTVSHNLASILNSTNPLYIGSYNGGEYTQWFDGKIGVVRIYNSALTDSQVLQNFNADKSKYGL